MFYSATWQLLSPLLYLAATLPPRTLWYSKNSNKKTPGGAQMVPFRPYAKKLLRILDFSPDLNKKVPTLCKRNFWGFWSPRRQNAKSFFA